MSKERKGRVGVGRIEDVAVARLEMGGWPGRDVWSLTSDAEPQSVRSKTCRHGTLETHHPTHSCPLLEET